MKKLKALICFVLAVLMLVGSPAAALAADAVLYSDAVSAIDAKNPPRQTQMTRYSADFNTRITGICNVCATDTLLNRRSAYDGADGYFTVTDVLKGCGCTDIVINGVNCSYTGDTGYTHSSTYTNANGVKYTTKKIEGAVAKGLSNSANFYLYIALLLHQHPEGIAIRNSAANHVAVITKYIVSGSKIQLFVNDPSGNFSGRLEDSYLYNYGGRDLYANLDYLSYVEGSRAITPLPFASVELEKGKTVSVAPVVGSWNASYSSSDSTVCSVNSSGTVTALKEGTATISVSISVGGSSAYVYRASVTVQPAVKITSQPASVTAAVGTTASFSVSASGSSLSYQWQCKAGSSSSWSNTGLTGSASQTLSVPAIAERNGYQYRCVVTNSAGSATSSAATLTVTQPSGWKQISGKWYYYANGAAVTGWRQISGKWYHFAASGVMQTGWQKLSGKWYYFDDSGAMRTGWLKISGKWYYLASSGVMQTGWQKLSGKWYYLDDSGAMRTGWLKLSGRWFYLNGSGVMQTGWKKLSGVWYYFESSGVMLANTSKIINGRTYHFNSSGACTDP